MNSQKMPPKRAKRQRNVEEDHVDKEEKIPGAWESVKETALLVGVGVMGHSWDTYSDVGFSYLLASGTYKAVNGHEATSQPKYATAMIIPVVLYFLFTINQWWKNEIGLKWKLITLPFLIAQLYPPFVAVRLVILLITRNKQWFKEKKLYDESMSSLVTFCPLLISAILGAIVACIDKCSCCSCSCCCDYCLPMTEIIPNTFGVEIKEMTYVQENAENFSMEDLEMSEQEDKKKEMKDIQENTETIDMEDSNSVILQKTSEQEEEEEVKDEI